ncbi:MAG: glycosyltransferase family A protein [Faecalicoccus sp.]|uniref:glycosyltransferase family 2 protein n=1 Tax=Faecalicoccus sp. TaxID=1971758 RepID=UPI002A920588|nr:glycosyltransferase family A protein [Faecalicoccus sp.]MDY5232272.1 glycosyltransferase family A protein [Faecalicoccus sp.]
MRFSIIIPIYNTEMYLDKCINSILNQTFSDYELFLIDDCSTDSSLTIAYKYKSNRVKILKNSSNFGLSETRNIGIKKATGDYIVFLDSDDYFERNALFNLNKLICEHEFPDIIYTGFIEERGTNMVKKYGYVSAPNKIYSNYDYFRSELRQRTLYAAACFGIYKRKTIIDNKLFFKKGIYHEDELWTPQVINKAKKIYLSDLAYYHYVRRDGSITKVKDKTKNGVDLIDTCYELIKIFSNMEDKNLKKKIDNHTAMLYMKAMCRGRLYRKEYINLIDKKFPIRYASFFIGRVKALLFFISPYYYYLLDKKYGDNEL